MGLYSLCLGCKIAIHHSLLVTSGNPTHVQVYILVMYHFMRAEWLCYSTQQLVMNHLNYMWCLTMSSPQIRLKGKQWYPPEWKDLYQISWQSFVPDNIYLIYIWFTSDIVEDSSGTPWQKTSIVSTTDNKNNTLASSTPKLHAHEGLTIKLSFTSSLC